MTEENKVKLLKDYSVDEVIETLFKLFFKNDNILHPRQIQQDAIYEFGFGSNKTEGAIKKMVTYDIIDIDNNRTISLTKEGFKVIQLGSWKDYLEYLKNIEDQKEADRQLAREVNQSVKTTNKNQIVILYLTIVVSVVSLILSVLTYCKNDPQDVRILSPIVLSQSDTISEKVISRFQERINDSILFSKTK